MEYKSLESFFTHSNLLGKGGYGMVYKGRWGKLDVAIKVLKKTDSNIEKEGELMRALDHPHILRCHGLCKGPNRSALVLEYLPGGTLHKLLHAKEIYICFEQKKRCAAQICLGLAYLHSKNIIHLDIKSENILLGTLGEAKIADFGLSRMQSGSVYASAASGTVRWMAPELLREPAKITSAADIYSLGVTLWELLTRREPFPGAHFASVLKHVAKGKREKIPRYAWEFGEAIEACWKQDPRARPEAEVIGKKYFYSSLTKQVDFLRCVLSEGKQLTPLLAKQLTHIDLSCSSFAYLPDAFETICPGLRELHIRDNKQLKLFGKWGVFVDGPFSFPELRHLDLRGCSALRKVRVIAPRLQTLNVMGCPDLKEINPDWGMRMLIDDPVPLISPIWHKWKQVIELDLSQSSKKLPGQMEYEAGVAWLVESRSDRAIACFEMAAEKEFPAAYQQLGFLDGRIFDRKPKIIRAKFARVFTEQGIGVRPMKEAVGYRFLWSTGVTHYQNWVKERANAGNADMSYLVGLHLAGDIVNFAEKAKGSDRSNWERAAAKNHILASCRLVETYLLTRTELTIPLSSKIEGLLQYGIEKKSPASIGHMGWYHFLKGLQDGDVGMGKLGLKEMRSVVGGGGTGMFCLAMYEFYSDTRKKSANFQENEVPLKKIIEGESMDCLQAGTRLFEKLHTGSLKGLCTIL